MDETSIPLRIPPLMSIYADKHNVFNLMQNLLYSLLIDQPDDPLSFLIAVLQRSSVDIPRVLVLGPPAAGKNTVAKRLSTELKAVHVTKSSLLQHQTELSTHSQQDTPSELLVRLVKKRLKETDCFNWGWVLEGIPQTRLQALSLHEDGIIPVRVVMLEAADDVLLQRSEGRLIDPVTGDVYHETFIRPPNDTIAQRLTRGQGLSEEQRLAELQRYRLEFTGLSSAYQGILKVINGDQPPDDVYQQVLTFVQTRRRSRTPRILLLGPTGSGKSLQARMLSEKYKLADVCCGQLLRSVAADGSSLGALIQPYLNEECPVPDNLVLQVLEECLSQEDCSCRGWILHGFPQNLQQANSLQKTILEPNRVFFLEATDEVCLERISLRATDPVSGERYHAVTQPAPNSEIQNRLKTRPEDSPESVTQRLTQYRASTAVLQSVYPDAVHIDADQDPHSVFEALESRLTID